ncbi:hypothetical protein [Wohlfahrtiimonas larvae]|nr:hypothetical protein [Wohlfahrtiimonas larvae]
MIKQEHFQQLFISLSQQEKDDIVRSAILMSEQFKAISIAELMRKSHYHAKEAMQTFRFKKQRIHHAILFAALQHAMRNRMGPLMAAA